MNLIRGFVGRPVTTVMVVSVFVVLGFVSYQRMVVDLFPELDFPLVQVISVYPGAGPEEIESQMVKKIEDEVSNISDIKEMQSEISEGYAFTIIRFNLNVDPDIKALDVKDKIEQIKGEFPEAAEDPIIAKYDPLSVPVVKVALLSEGLTQTELFELADKEIKNYFAQVTGVAKVDVIGGAKRQINVLARQDKLGQYGLTIGDLVQVLGRESIDVPAGDLAGELREIGVRFKGEARSVADLQELDFNAPGHGVIRLSDVATVVDGSAEADSVVRFKGKEAVLLEVYKRADGNTISVADGIRELIPEVEGLLPPGVSLEIADDASVYIRNAVDNALSNIVVGVLLCALVLWVFLRDLRITFVAAVVIPTSIVSAFLLMDSFNFSLNILTLPALGISIGALVANAIVVLENISRHIEEGEEPKQAAVGGTGQVAVAVMAAAGTNIVVFTPIAFMGGIVGKFFYQFGLTVVFATLFSLLASFSLTPMLSAVFLKKTDKEAKPRLALTRILHFPLEMLSRFVKKTEDVYNDTLRPVLRFPKLTALLTFVFTAAAIYLPLRLGYIGGEFNPSSDQGQLTFQIQLPKGSTREAALDVLRQVEAVILANVPPEELQDYTSQAGGENAGFDEARVLLRLVDADKRERGQNDVIYALQEPLARIPGAEIVVFGEKSGPGTSDLDILVRGPDYEKLGDYAEKMRRLALETGNFRSVFNTYRPPKEELHFYPSSFRRAQYMIPNALIGMTMRYSIEGQESAVLRVGGEEYDVKVRLDERSRNSTEDVRSYRLSSPLGRVPLSQLGRFERAKGIAKIFRRDKQRVIQLNSYIANKSMSENQALLTEKFDREIDWEKGYGYAFAGAAEEQAESFANIRLAFMLAVILTYMLLAAILNSFVHPLTILVTVPLGMVGVIGTMFFFGINFSIMSTMAMVMLVGIVVNNAILIIDQALQLLKTCSKTAAECAHEASVAKFRAILMTNLAIVAGILPQVMGGSGSEFMMPMAAATMGGVVASAIFTLFAIPALFLIVERMIGQTRNATAWISRKLLPPAGTDSQ